MLRTVSTYCLFALVLATTCTFTTARPTTFKKPTLSERDAVVPTFSSLIPISQSLLDLVQQRTRDSAHQSWELGVMAQAYLEIDWPHMSVFGAQSVPPPRSVTANNGLDNITTILQIANYVIDTRPAGAVTLIEDGAVGDPASVGVAILLANWTHLSRPDLVGKDYNTPLRQQMGYLWDTAPKTDDGAISHRSEQVQVWSDFIYMTPPFLAYYAALAQPYTNGWVLWQSYEQIRLYRNYLHDPSSGLWKHVALGNWQDDKLWSTGNGWAAAGMLRVLVTINQTTLGYQPQFVAAQRDLQNWATEIVNNIWLYQQPSGTLLNYANDGTSFAESASTALLASVTYRLAAISTYLRGPNSASTWDPSVPDRHPAVDMSTLPDIVQLSDASLQAAHKARDFVRRNLDPTTGWLNNVVDPYTFSKQGSQSPEGQSFVLLMESAWRVWRDLA